MNYITMKNLRMAKKNPSKILKIIEGPSSNRYHHNYTQHNNSSHLAELAITTSRQRSYRLANPSSGNPSPQNSQRIIEFSSLQKAKKARSRNFNKSEELIKTQEKDPVHLVMKQSIGNKSRQEHSPYIKDSRYRNSDKFLNFNSVNLGERRRRDSRQSREVFKSSSRKKHTILRDESLSGEKDQRDDLQVLESAKKLLNGGDYRKSLLVIKSILKSKPEHTEALYLSAVNWYHLQDKQRTHFYTEQLIRSSPAYSPQIYKLKAACYLKTNEYSKGLHNLQLCHELFPDEPESYEFEGKIFGKMRKWKDAISSYRRSYELTGNVDILGMVASCHEELQDWNDALECYTIILSQGSCHVKYLLRKIRIHHKRQEYEQIVKTVESAGDIEQLLQGYRQRDEIYYLCSYSHYKNKKYSSALIMIDEGLRYCEHESFAAKFHQLLLMIKIIQRDIYEAHHFLQRLEDEPELQVMKRFVEGVINLMRRNHNQGIALLLSIQSELGFRLEGPSSLSNHSELSVQEGGQVPDQFCNQLRKSYLLFLSYGYIAISEFHTALRMMQLQRDIGVPAYFELGLTYNQQLCTGVILHCDRKFKQAESHFIRAKAIYDNKLEPPFSLSINYLQRLVNSSSEIQRLSLIQEAKGQFDVCKKIVGRAPSNTAASLYYFNCLLHGYLEQWKEALACIDESIDRAEDHYWRYYYIRGMLLACIHSFKEAINDITIAINLSGNTKPECYILRSKCLQIEGEGNEAFRDLQEYISLKPDDPEVHKYAGQLLFQNGAFEDSLTAFSHQPIPLILQNYDAFLTQSKSFFLLGMFSQAIASISQANSLDSSPQVLFDIKVFEFLKKLTSGQDVQTARQQLETTYGDFSEIGRIFKASDFYLLRATCFMLQKKYSQALQAFTITIREKTIEISGSNGQDEETQTEIKKEVDSFANQMYYNMAICNLDLGQLEQAQQSVQSMKIPLDQPYYSDFVNFKKWVTGQVQMFNKQQVFPSRNKLSNYLPKVAVAKEKQPDIFLKLCVPFPKVEPPEIFPSFDRSLLQRLSVLNVERKPEAPWILRQVNSIKFTQKMEVFSRLELDDSQSQSGRSTYNMASVDRSRLGNSSHHIGRSSHHSQLKVASQKQKSRKYQLLNLIE